MGGLGAADAGRADGGGGPPRRAAGAPLLRNMVLRLGAILAAVAAAAAGETAPATPIPPITMPITMPITAFHVDTESCSGLVHDNVTAQRISCAAFLGGLKNLSTTLVHASQNLNRTGDGSWLRLAVDAGTGWVCPQPQPCTPPYCGCINISFGGKNVSVAEHVVDLADETVLMDYRTTAAAVYAGAVAYLKIADAHPADKKVRVGVATSPPPGPPWATRNESELAALMAAAEPLLSRHPSFVGFSVFGPWTAVDPAPSSTKWPVGTGTWYTNHSMITDPDTTTRDKWLSWAKIRGISEIYIAPHAGANALISIGGIEGGPYNDRRFCEFIGLAGQQGLGVQLLSDPITDYHFLKNCTASKMDDHAASGFRKTFQDLAKTQSAKYTVDLTTTTAAPFPHHWEECVGSGHASLTLRADWRAHLTKARRDLGIKRTRFHGLLDDDFSISLGPSQCPPWSPNCTSSDPSAKDSYVNLDSLIDFLDSLGMDSPLFELSFMPSWLATNTSRTVTHYKGIVSAPKNYSEFGQIIYRMGVHLKQRYPEKKMMFEVWNEPNGGFWQPGNSSDPKSNQLPSYLELYKVSADALKAVDAVSFSVGGPATAGCPGWTEQLVAFGKNTSTAVDFVSCHNYGGGGGDAFVGNLEGAVGSLPQTKKLAAGKPVVITEWSSSWMYTVDYHDEPGSAPFIVAACALMDGFVNISSYWVFSDVFEEGGVLPGPFHGGFGLMTVHGTPKPAYRAFQLLHGAGDKRLPVVGTCPCGNSDKICGCNSGDPPTEKKWLTQAVAAAAVSRCVDGNNNTASGVLATKNATAVRLFLYNHPGVSGTNGSDCAITVALSGLASMAGAKMTRIDSTNSNPKAAYVAMGSPPYPTVAQLAALELASELHWGTLEGGVAVGGGGGSFTLTVPANGMAVVDVPLQ